MESQLQRTVVREPFWSLSVQDTLAILHTSKVGLTEDEVSRRRQVFGKNSLSRKDRLGKIRILWHQIANPLIIILIFAGVLTWFLKEYIEAGVIFGAVVVNTLLGFWQENKAETVLELLKSYVTTRVRVRRGGRDMEVDAEELVPGDIVHLSQGERIPADGRIIFADGFEVDEAILTGESLPSEKNPDSVLATASISDRNSVVFSGTLVTEGVAEAVVSAIDDDTEFGRIARMVSAPTLERTPLQRALARFSNRVGFAMAMLVTVLLIFGIIAGQGFLDMFLIAVAVAVSVVPEGLPIALTVILAVGVQRLATKKGIVRRLLAAETLGSTSLILTDKTGTLTQAKMEIDEVISYGETGEDSVNRILEHSLWNTDAVIDNPNDDPAQWNVTGRALYVSLVRQAGMRGVKLPEVLTYGEVLARLPFSSSYKFSACAVRFGSHRRIIILGAPDIILKFSDFNNEKRKEISKDIEVRARSGQKVLGVASVQIQDSEYEKIFKEKKFNGIKFEGIISLRDPLRPQAKESIEKIRSAGVRVVMVTGDHVGTAEAIAQEVGLSDGRDESLSGDDLRALQPEEISARAGDVTVYARVTPEQKLQLARMYQERGDVVAVTGDGVNDAPALKQADIGVALGSGSDVAKSVADLVILDDNFETIVAAIEEGRRILDNIKKVIVYLLSNSFSELLLIGGSLIVGVPIPITASQILFVNFFSDSFPALALAFEKGIDHLGEKPRNLDKSLFDSEMRFIILGIGALTSVVLFVLYIALTITDAPTRLTNTFIFASFGTYSLFAAFSMRSLSKSIFSYNPFSNKYILYGVSFGLVLMLSAIYIPALQDIFGTTALPLPWLAGVLGVGALNVMLLEYGKYTHKNHE